MNLPYADVLIHSGDFTLDGEEEEVIKFNEWLGKLPHKHKIVIAGNHEICLDLKFKLNIKKILSNCTYLEHQSAIVNNINIFGTPYQPVYYDMAFNINDKDRKKLFDKIPEDTNILITHCPPYGILDKLYDNKCVGDKVLLDCINTRLKSLKYHAFGHIHEANGLLIKDGVTYINAAICNLNYKPNNKYYTFEI